MWKRKPATPDDIPQPYFMGLSKTDFYILAQYNQECARGLAHTPEWDERMADLQKIYHEGAALEAQAWRSRNRRSRS